MGRIHRDKVNAKRKEKKKLSKLKQKDRPVVFQKKEIVPQLRQRVGISLLEPKGSIPNCPHGPCLLFTDGKSKWFGCAVYRSEDLCKYRVNVRGGNELEYKDAKPIKYEYGNGILSQINDGKLKNNQIYYCQTCCAYVTIPHKDPVVGPTKLNSIPQHPSQILSASKTNKGSAQYWFKPEVLNIVRTALEGFDSVLCIGCPSVFEELWKEKNAFMLDFDHRFSNFFSAKSFAHYSLLNNHFYQTNGVEDLKKFFKKAKKLCILVDPPFGAILSALESSLDKLKKLFLSTISSGKVNTIVFSPVFMGKHLHGLSIVDYKVTYENHAQFKHRNKTIVRMFTDIDQIVFKLPVDEGYKFCKSCKRFVANENAHCVECDSCTTTFGPTFKHCDKCKRCVKPQYEHCSKCKRCHLPNRCIA